MAKELSQLSPTVSPPALLNITFKKQISPLQAFKHGLGATPTAPASPCLLTSAGTGAPSKAVARKRRSSSSASCF